MKKSKKKKKALNEINAFYKQPHVKDLYAELARLNINGYCGQVLLAFSFFESHNNKIFKYPDSLSTSSASLPSDGTQEAPKTTEA